MTKRDENDELEEILNLITDPRERERLRQQLLQLRRASPLYESPFPLREPRSWAPAGGDRYPTLN